jgi:hypothetical protein
MIRDSQTIFLFTAEVILTLIVAAHLVAWAYFEYIAGTIQAQKNAGNNVRSHNKNFELPFQATL